MAVKIETLAVITVASGGTAVPLSSTSLPVNSVTIQADFANIGNVSFGDSTVDADNGIAIPPGDTAEVEGPIGPRGYAEEFDLATVYVNSSTTGNKVRVIAFRRAL